jgi:quercetin dioxygenase-like cupin family protein
MRQLIVLLITVFFLIVSSVSFAADSDMPSADDSKHKWTDQEKFGTELPIPGYREGMADMVSEGTLKKYSTSKYPDWYRASYYYKAAVGPPSWVSTGLEANHFSMGTMTFKPGTIYPIHNHPAWEVYYVLEGEGIVRKYDREYKVKPGDYFMNRPYDVHSFINTSDTKPLRVIWTWWTEGGEGLTFYKGGVPIMLDKCWKDKETACTTMEPPRILKESERYEFMRDLEPKK